MTRCALAASLRYSDRLGRFAPGAGVEIPDPYGGEVEAYRRVYCLIRQSVAAWLAGPADTGGAA